MTLSTTVVLLTDIGEMELIKKNGGGPLKLLAVY